MNKFFKNVNTFGLTVVVIAGGLIFTQSAFKSVNPNRFDTSYFFIGSDNSKMRTLGAWKLKLDTDNYTCGGVEQTPCEIKVSAGQTLANYLETHTNNQIINDSLSKREDK
ncbi:hypothetical protein [Pedobacter sp. UYP1]|uniref:hypothetical protein n=1 Tax=Pedobacter sp. UYP1 TaxID=1756396 RepID=UPI003395994C